MKNPHCRNGHLRTPENTAVGKTGPYCKTCYAINVRARDEARRDARRDARADRNRGKA